MAVQNKIRIAHIVATAKDNVIGDKNTIPWRSKVDLAFFKKATMGFPIIMGRKTYDSIPGKLLGRSIFVVTRDKKWKPEVRKGDCVEVHHSIDSALETATSWAICHGMKIVWIAGGADIYKATLPHVDMIMRTSVDIEVYGDTHYPELNEWDWYPQAEPEVEMDGDLKLTFERWGRNRRLNKRVV